MIKWDLIDSTEVPADGGFMQLVRRGEEMVIRVDGRDLMSTRMHGSEDALSDLACDYLDKNPTRSQPVRILIGGMGIGFTLAAALGRVGPDAEVTVAELVPAVVEWNKGDLGNAAGHPINDPRTRIYNGDVADLIKKPPAPWDAILLDVDNGPEGLTKSSNDWLYCWNGLTAAYKALTPHGVLGVWSAAAHERFTRRLKQVGFNAAAIPVRARAQKGGKRHVIWICTR